MSRRRPVLVVDDDPDLCALLRRALEHSGYDVVTAENGMDGIRQFELNRPAMLIVDLMMPKLDGEEFLRMLGSTRPPVLLLTASDRREEAAARYNVDASLGKPFDLADIRSIVAQHCGEHRRTE